MTEQEFVKKAKVFGYSDGWIKNSIEEMHKLNAKYGFDYSYEDIVIKTVKNSKGNSKFVWKESDVVIFKPKNKKR